jgi:hypothetical protein
VSTLQHFLHQKVFVLVFIITETLHSIYAHVFMATRTNIRHLRCHAYGLQSDITESAALHMSAVPCGGLRQPTCDGCWPIPTVFSGVLNSQRVEPLPAKACYRPGDNCYQNRTDGVPFGPCGEPYHAAFGELQQHIQLQPCCTTAVVILQHKADDHIRSSATASAMLAVTLRASAEAMLMYSYSRTTTKVM